MTLQQAKQALEQGLRVRHTSFKPDPFVEKYGTEVKSSDGITCPQNEYWNTAKTFRFNEGWSIVPKEGNTVPTEDDLDYNFEDYPMGPEVTDLG